MFVSSVAKARQLVALLVLVSISSLIVLAQEQKQTPEDKQRKIKNEPNKAFRQWINDHEVILTQSEREAWTNSKQTMNAKSTSRSFGAAATQIPIRKKTNTKNSFTSVSLTRTNTSLRASLDE